MHTLVDFFCEILLFTFKKTALDQVEYLKHLRRKNLEINNDIEVINHLNSIKGIIIITFLIIKLDLKP